jgi:serine phosphatase RsbU (regulator of sigma subunit)
VAIKPIEIAAAARAYPGEEVNGDAWRVDRDGDRVRIAVIDGLGHGAEAATASSLAVASLAEDQTLDPVAAIVRCHHELLGTRGAAAGVVLIDPLAQHLVFAGLGNVEARLWQNGSEKRLSSARGIVGSALRTIRPETVALGTDWRLVLHSDGISSRFRLEEVVTPGQTLNELANEILVQWGRVTDDATVVVAGTA